MNSAMIRIPLVDLIPAGKGLHSAILTTFSFDFCFLDNLVSKLRSKGIVNIIVLADGEMLDGSAGALRAQENLGKTYTVLGYPQHTLFHPKIFLFAGKDHATLIAGSGNLGVHGFGKNAENFNYFGFEGPDDPKVQLLHQCWDYLKTRLTAFAPEALSQLDAIKKQAPWLETALTGPLPAWITLEADTSVSFIANGSGSGTLQQITERIAPENISRITVMAPFHDKDGSTIHRLARFFPEAVIRLVLQDNYGQLPMNLDADHLEFYDYQDVIEKNWKGNPCAYFHSKLIVFEGPDHTYVYSGSANASTAALGTGDGAATNEEAGFLWRKPSLDIGDYLGLDFSVEQKLLSYFKPADSFPGDDTFRRKKKFFIRSATYHVGELKITLDPLVPESGFNATVYDREMCETGAWPLAPGSAAFCIKPENRSGSLLCFVAITNPNVEAASSKHIIQNVTELRRTYPSEGNRLKIKAEEAMAAGMFDDPVILEAILSLLENHEACKRKRIVLAKKYAEAEYGTEKEEREYSRKEIEEELKRLQVEEEYNLHFEKDLLDSIVKAVSNAECSQQESDHDREAELNENGDAPAYEPHKRQRPVSQGELARTRNRIMRLVKITEQAGRENLGRDALSNSEFETRLHSLNLALFAFFGYTFNSFTVIDKKETHIEVLYPEYGALISHTSRLSIFLSLCGTTLNLLPFFSAHRREPDLEKSKTSILSYILLGISIFWETEEARQTEKNRILLGIFLNLRHFFHDDHWAETDLPSLHARLSIVNQNAIILSPERFDTVLQDLHHHVNEIPDMEFLLHDTLGYFKIDDYKPAGAVTDARSFLLSRVGFPYLADNPENKIYKRWYNKQSKKFFEVAKRTMAGYDKEKVNNI